MGHCVNYIIADKDVNKEQIIADICFEVEQEDWAEGGCYSGSLARKGHWHDNVIYDNQDEAEKAIDKFDNGYYDDHAVLFYDTSSLENAKTKKLVEQIDQTKNKKLEYVEANHVHNRKSTHIGCPKCGSKLAREYLRRDTCPLCQADLRSATVQKRLVDFDKKVAELEVRLVDEKKKLIKKAPVKWLIKYEYHI